MDDATGNLLCAAPGQNTPANFIGLIARKIGDWEQFSLLAIHPEKQACLPSHSDMFEATQHRLLSTTATPDTLAQSLLDNAFAANAFALSTGPASTLVEDEPAVVDQALDGLVDATKEWSSLKSINFYIMRGIASTRTCAVVASAKNEGIYIIEWAAHCRAVGFDHIFVYTNDNTDDSLSLLQILHANGVITLIVNNIGSGASPQVKAYEHSIHLLPQLRQFEWVAYFDVDEFLIPDVRYDYSVKRLLRDSARKWSGCGPAAICVNWAWYGSNGAISREDGLLQERFLYSIPHNVVKSIVRLSQISTMWPIHLPDPGHVFCVDSSLDRIEMLEAFTSRPNYGGAKLNHYFQKSFEEFGVKKSRGRGGSAGGLSGKEFETFFEWDVSASNGYYSPSPPVLLERVKLERDKILALPSVRKAHLRTHQAHKRIAFDFYNGDIKGNHKQRRGG